MNHWARKEVREWHADVAARAERRAARRSYWLPRSAFEAVAILTLLALFAAFLFALIWQATGHGPIS